MAKLTSTRVKGDLEVLGNIDLSEVEGQGDIVFKDDQTELARIWHNGSGLCLSVTDDPIKNSLVITNEHLKYLGNFIYHEGYKPTKSDVGLSEVNNWSASSSIYSNSDTTYATTSLVYKSKGSIPEELKQARTGYDGTVYNDLKTRLDTEFRKLAEKIPTNLTVNGNGSVTTNKTLDSSAHGTSIYGRTWVNSVESGLNLKYSKSRTIYTVIVNSSIDESATLKHDNVNILSTFKKGINVAKYETVYEPTLTLTRTGSAVLTDLMVIEGDWLNYPYSFFTGMKSSELASVNCRGANLIDPNISRLQYNCVWLAEYYKLSTTQGSSPYVTLGKFWLEKGKRYKHGYTNSNYTISSFKLCKYGELNTDFNYENTAVSESGWYEIYIGMRTGSNPFDYVKPYVYEVTGSQPTSPLPYEESSVIISQNITLRSLPSGLSDSYDLDTNTITRRVGTTTLSSTADYKLSGSNTNVMIFWISTTALLPNAVTYANAYNLVFDRFMTLRNAPYTGYIESVVASDSTIYIAVNKSRLPAQTVAGFKSWLASNPVLLNYQLATPTKEYVSSNGVVRSFNGQTTVSTTSTVPVGIKSVISVGMI